MKPGAGHEPSNRVMAIAIAPPLPTLGRLETLLFAFGLEDANRMAGLALTRDPAHARGRTADTALVQRARQGDQDSYRILVERHGSAAYSLALRIVQSPQDAEEIAQDAFVRAWRALPQFRGDAAFSTWLYRIVMRQALGRAASLRRKKGVEEPLDERTIETLAEPAPRERHDPTRLRLERIVAGLPELQRAVVTLFYIQDRSLREVAAALNLPLGTVKTHLYRSRAALRRAWARETAGEDRNELRGF